MTTPSLLERILDPYKWDSLIDLLMGGGVSQQEAIELVLSVYLKIYGEPDARRGTTVVTN